MPADVGGPAPPPVAMCILRAEHRDPDGLVVTVTINPNVLSPPAGTGPHPRRIAYATDVDAVLVLVQRFLRDFLRGSFDAP
jgi:hypothetical protein